MKRIIFLIVSVAIGHATSAQTWTSGTNLIYTTGSVGIGTASPAFPLDVPGVIHTKSAFIADVQNAGDAGAWFRGAANGSANVILQGGAGGYQAFWLSATNGIFKIGASGGVEPTTGAINIDYLGNVGIGTTAPGSFKLAVEGKIGAREVKVTLQNPWPDYVFNKDYSLMSLASLEAFIKKNNHLPNIPSAQEVKENGGIDLGEMNAKLLEKIEELTLHMIEMNKQATEMNKKVQTLEKENEEIKKLVAELINKQKP